MKYTDMQTIITKDNLIIDYIKKEAKGKKIILKTGHTQRINRDELVIFVSGYSVQGFAKKKNFFLINENELIYNPIEDYTEIEAFDTSEFFLYEANHVFDLLERADMLSHFFYMLFEQSHQKLNIIKMLNESNPRERVLYAIKLIQGISKTGNLMPSWFSSRKLAQLSWLSNYTTSLIVRDLKESGFIRKEERKKHNFKGGEKVKKGIS